MATALPLAAFAQGVPIADGKSIIQHELEIAQMSYLSGARELEADKKRRSADLHQDQLEALDATLAMMTGIVASPSRPSVRLTALPKPATMNDAKATIASRDSSDAAAH